MRRQITTRIAGFSPRTLLVFTVLLAIITVALMAPRCTNAAQTLRAPAHNLVIENTDASPDIVSAHTNASHDLVSAHTNASRDIVSASSAAHRSEALSPESGAFSRGLAEALAAETVDDSSPFCAPTGPSPDNVTSARTLDQHTITTGDAVTTTALGLEPIVTAVSPTHSHTPAAPLPQDLGISRT
ncbi:hypothetical protein M2390_002692 [Mycetocola sp. BIGb0189]|uniref:hypothetical protein n=1 Tax=Mycetocola sp. BIGb0189 TaxID=2940604 RepID=UPI0021685004|nr:hypothetical protein [Mycetocola sp. BIGb0189]MCS4277486.1 hypothetical protein [Mycetocola sp. BIGb0189]